MRKNSAVADCRFPAKVVPVNHETPPTPEDSANTVILRFDEDRDEAHQQLESEAHLVNAIPRTGEIVNIDHQFHAVTQVIHNYDANGIEIHLGPSSETAKEAQEKAS